MVFVKNILPFIMTIPVPLTSLKILFNILELNILRYDTTSSGSLSKMVHSLLSLFTLMIRRLICSLSLLIENGLNSYAKTLQSPWSDLSSFSSYLMHLHLVLYFALFNMFMFVYFLVLLYFVLHKNKNKKSEKKQCVFVYIGTCVPWMAIEIKFSKLYIFYSLDEHLYAQLSK